MMHMVIISIATGSDSESSSSLASSASSRENPLVLSYESSPFGSEDESGPEGVLPFLYELLTASNDEESDSVEDSIIYLNW